ncbi:MAG: ABC transporter substrate-binding protein, partial [bacterium]
MSKDAKTSRRDFLEMLATLGVASGVGGITILPGEASAQQKGKSGGTLIMVVTPEPPTLASYMSTANPVGVMCSKMYEGLCEYDFNLRPIPGLAKSWEISSDNRTITFNLQGGVKFHDGRPFTSADVQFSIMDVLKKVHPRGPSTFSAVTAVETPNPQTAVVKLGEPAPYIMSALSGYESPMLPKHLLGTGDVKASPLGNRPVGTGPFKFVEWRRGEFIRLDRNADYWKKGRPYLDRIVARFIDSTQTRSAAMQAGEVQFGAFSAIPFSDVKRLQAVPGIAATTKGYEMISPIVELEINTTRGPFKSEKGRQAIAYAIDRKFVIDNVWFSFGKPATGPISSNFKATGMYTADVKSYDVPNRMELAAKLLDDAGFPKGANGVRFETTHDMIPFGDEWRRFGEYVKQALGQL